ncbi:MAG: IclR family transcriptional regulator [Candidatus Tectomicrobia bacterium]|nr:IclR family transcriptional regulator [Candidatus Tectomicrobia bacterium]
MRTLSTVEKAIDVLHLLAKHRSGLSVKEVAQHLGVQRSTAHQFLASLKKKELLEQHPVTRHYVVGARLLSLGMAYARNLNLQDRVQPILKKLRDQAGETVLLLMRSGDKLVYVAQVESLHFHRSIVLIGDYIPLHFGASGAVVLAHLPDAEAEESITRLRLNTLDWRDSKGRWDPLTLLNDGFRQKLAKVRKQGYCASFEQLFKSVNAIAAPVFDLHDHAAGCVSIVGPSERFTQEVVKSQIRPLLETAQEVSSAFGSGLVWDERGMWSHREAIARTE